MQQPERRTRFERERPPGLVITARDIAILEAAAQHRFVRSTHVQALMPEDPPAKILRRLHKLYHNGYLDRPRAQIDYHQGGGGSKPMVYGLTSRGEWLLAEETGNSPRRRDTNTTRLFLEHTLAVTDFMVALEQGCRECGDIRIIEPDEILENASEWVQRQPNPFMWETRVRWGGEEHRIHVAPDKVFGIEHADGSRRYYFLEMDRGTMPVARSDLGRTSLLRKFLSYDATFRDNLHRRLYGLPGFQVLTVTTSEERIGTCVEVLGNLMHPREVEKRFLFAANSSTLAVDGAPPLAMPWMNGTGNTVQLEHPDPSEPGEPAAVVPQEPESDREAYHGRREGQGERHGQGNRGQSNRRRANRSRR